MSEIVRTRPKVTNGKWHALGKNRSSNRPADQAAQQAFQEELGDLFDCAASDAIAKIVIEEDRQFLFAQREKGRRGLMAGVDMKLAEMEARKAASFKAQVDQKEKATQYATEATATLELEDSDDTHSSCSSSSFPFMGVALPPPGTDAAGASTSSAPPLGRNGPLEVLLALSSHQLSTGPKSAIGLLFTS